MFTVAFTAFFVLWLILRPDGEDGLVWFSDLTLSSAAILAGLVTFSAAFLLNGRDRWSWMLMAAGVTCWGLGQVVWSYYELVLDESTPFPSFADLGYLMMPPLMFLGLLVLPTRPAPTGERLKIGLDALIIMASIATVGWYFILGPIYDTADATFLEKYIGLAYPLGDLILLFALVGGVARGWITRRSPIFLFLVLGIIAFVVADVSFAYLTLHDAYISGSPSDLGWPLGFMLVAMAALERSAHGDDSSEPIQEQRVERSLASRAGELGPYVLVIGVTILLFYSRFEARGLIQNIFVGAALITIILVLVRQLVTLRENARLNKELRVRYESAKDLADRDPVTGLFNHRYFHTRLDELLAEAEANGTDVGVVIMDINDFKLFNDTYGHPAGDEVLRLVASGLQIMAERENVIPCRFGGDEFAVAVPGADDAKTIDFVRRMSRWLDSQSFAGSDELIPIRLSFGYAVYPQHGSRRHQVVSAADSSLYEAKRSGAGVISRSKSEPRAARAHGTYTVLESLITSVDNKDKYTKAHCDYVSEYAVLLAQALGLSPEVERALAVAGALHDVGKICIPDNILRKPGPLTDDEYEMVKLHVPLAANLIQDVSRRKDVLDAVLHHHERFDGTGYAKGLKGEQIPWLGRIIAIADAFSAMTLDRPYRKAMSIERAVEELRRNSGSQFDPDLVPVFIAALQRHPAHGRVIVTPEEVRLS